MARFRGIIGVPGEMSWPGDTDRMSPEGRMSAGQNERAAGVGVRDEGREMVRISEVALPTGVDSARLERGLGLKAVRVGDGRYHVTGGAQDHWVDLYSERIPRCDCGDHLWRDAVCKHMLAALVREGDERVVRAIGELVETLRAA